MYMVENTPTLMSKTEEAQEEEEEEALSLCDLPIVETMKNEKESGNQNRGLEELQEEDFEFGSWGAGSLLKESDMCAAEDVFFQGQILPLRLSVSSDGGIARIGQDSRNPSRCPSRTESMDHGFTSSSRSSSIRSGNSNSSSSGSSVTTTITRRSGSGYKERERDLSRNHFHAHPSPRPQIWQATAPAGNGGSRSRRSTAWGLFRPGLMRTPEIELHDLKVKLRNRNKSCESNNRREEAKKQETKLMKTTTQRMKMRMFEGLTSGCKCSVSAVETVPSRFAIIKKVSAIEREENEEQQQQQQQQQQQLQEQNKQGKQAMAHRRTFEWLKQLSLADLQQEA